MNDARNQLLVVKGLTKRFGGTLALDSVDLTVERGQIHALIGENGAGKSTFIKILAGLFPADAGEIRFQGVATIPSSAHLPIHFVHQDLGLFDDLSIGENIAMVAGFPRRFGMIDWRRVWESAETIYQGLDLDPPNPRHPVHALGAAGKAILGIVRALAHESVMLVLDEPTAALPEPDARKLFDVLRRLRGAGTGMLYVSHRLSELFSLADCVTVLRDGRRVKHARMGNITPDMLIYEMLGRIFEPRRDALPHAVGKPVLEVLDLVLSGRRPLSFSVGVGEIVGLVGLRGAGQDAIGRTIFGCLRPDAGAMRINGKLLDLHDSVGDRIAAGVSLLPADRARESAFQGMSVRENLLPHPCITHSSHWDPISPSAERVKVDAALERLDVRPRNSEAIIDWLSGGNQQKVFIGRWLAAAGELLILEEPTAGVDVGAKFQIHEMLRAAAKDGAGILVVSSDFEEVTALCHRALVISQGAIVREFTARDLTVDGLLSASSVDAAQEAPVERQEMHA